MAAFILTLINMAIGLVLRGVTLVVLWDWFINGDKAPFKNVPDINFAQALGISLVVFFLTFQFSTGDTQDKDVAEVAGEALVKTIVFYIIVWIAALIYKFLLG